MHIIALDLLRIIDLDIMQKIHHHKRTPLKCQPSPIKTEIAIQCLNAPELTFQNRLALFKNRLSDQSHEPVSLKFSRCVFSHL